jgi:hypothetical protein
MGGERHVLAQCVTGGSSLLEDLAIEARQLDYQRLANPDSPMLWIAEICDSNLPKERRILALDRLLLIQPRKMAMSVSHDYNRGYTAHNLQTIIELARETERWSSAFFAANILSHAKFFTPELHENGQTFRLLTAQMIASLPETRYDALVSSDDPFLVSEDILLIREERQKYLAELARKAEKAKTRTSEVERELRQEKIAEIQQHLEVTCTSTRSHAMELITRDREEERRKQEVEPTLGHQATHEFSKEIHSRAAQIKEDTVVSTNSIDLDVAQFEFLKESAHLKLIESAISGKDGKRLQGNELEARLKLIQAIFVAKSYQLTGGVHSINTPILQSVTDERTREQAVIDLALKLNNQFTSAARTLNVQIPPFNPRVALTSVELKQLHN